MINVEHIGFYLPEKIISNLARKNDFGVDENFIQNKVGITSIRIKKIDEETSDMCVKAYLNLQEKSGHKNEEIDCLIVCTQNPDNYGLPHTSAIVHSKLSLGQQCAVFDISLGCSGYVYGLSIIKSFMEANLFNKGVLITADHYSKIIDEQDKNTSLLFGDAATATLLTNSAKNVWQIKQFVFGSNGSKCHSIKVDDMTQKFIMDGYDVCNFVAKTIPPHILYTIEKNNLSIDQIEQFIVHQGSKFIIDTVRRKLNVSPDRLPFLAMQYGNTVSSSIPMILKDTSLHHKYVLISGFGVGLSWASCILERT